MTNLCQFPTAAALHAIPFVRQTEEAGKSAANFEGLGGRGRDGHMDGEKPARMCVQLGACSL